MSEQLDVFLGVETKPFLEKLFIVINSEEYLTAINLDEHNTSGTTIGTIASPSTDASENLQNTEIRECTPPLLEQKAKDNIIIKTDESTPSSVQSGCSSGLPPVITAVVTPLIKIDESTILVKDKETRRRRTPLKSRSRSRSRSYDRSRRSRSRERRLNEREKPVRQFRNKSPPNRGRYGSRIERPFQRVQRQRSNSGSRSRSGSPDRRKISRSVSPTNGDSLISQSSKRQRCRDFDEKGYCMRGETCPWDHGVDPVVLEDINNPALISIQGGQNNNLRGQQVHGSGGEYNPDAPDLWSRGNSNNNFGQRGGSHRGSYPRGPANNFRGGPPFPFPINSAATTPLQQRELIPVPTVDGSSSNTGDNSIHSKRRFEPEDTVAIAEGPTKRKLPMNSRLGPRINAQQNCSLELRKVPRGLNSIAHLNNHFSKFGKIVNIQISYECDPEAAIITFSTHAEANVAYRSTEAVLNNRFIKVFWHTAGPSSDNQIHANIGGMAGGKDENLPNRRIYTSQHALNNIPATPVATTTESINKITSGINSSTTTTISTATSLVNLPAGTGVQQQQTPAQIRSKHNDTIRAKNELIRKKQEEQHKNAVQLQHGLHKRKHDLLQEHLKQMRSLLDRVEKVEHSDPRRSNFLSTIKGLQSSIDKLRNEIAIDQAQISARMQNPVPVKKSKEQQQKELLDVELELITQQQEGNDTTAIQKRLSDLQRSFGGGARGAYFPTRNVRVKPAPPGSTSVDRRPTTIQIVGFTMEESDSLLGHFKVGLIIFCFGFYF